MRDGIEGSFGALAPVIFVILALAQLAAFMEGLDVWLGLSGVWSVLLFCLLLLTGLLSALPVGLVGFYGATEGWGWEWWQAAILCFPFLVFCIVYVAGAGLVNVWGPALHRMNGALSERESSTPIEKHAVRPQPKLNTAGLWLAVLLAVVIGGAGLKLYSDQADALRWAKYERDRAIRDAEEARRGPTSTASKPTTEEIAAVGTEQAMPGDWQTEVVPQAPRSDLATGAFGNATTTSIEKLATLDDDEGIKFERKDFSAQIAGKSCEQVKREVTQLTDHRKSNGMPISFLLFEELTALEAFACDPELASYPPENDK